MLSLLPNSLPLGKDEEPCTGDVLAWQLVKAIGLGLGAGRSVGTKCEVREVRRP